MTKCLNEKYQATKGLIKNIQWQRPNGKRIMTEKS